MRFAKLKFEGFPVPNLPTEDIECIKAYKSPKIGFSVYKLHENQISFVKIQKIAFGIYLTFL